MRATCFGQRNLDEMVCFIEIESTLLSRGDYGWFQRKDARTQRAVANDSLRPGVFALIFVLYLKAGTECGTMVAEK